MIYSTPLQVCLGKLPDSLWKAKKSNSTKTKKKKCISNSLSAADGKVLINWNTDRHVSLVLPKRPRSLPSPRRFRSYLVFLKLLSQPCKLCSQPNVKKSFWNQKNVHMCWTLYGSSALLSEISRKQKEALWSLRRSLPFWQPQAGSAERCPRAMQPHQHLWEEGYQRPKIFL